jgi:taurine dioxygenase
VQECTAYRHLQVSPVAGALGAEVQGVDLARPLAPEIVEEIRQALLAHLVTFFPRQQLGPAELLVFAERFGQPTECLQMKGLPGYADVIAVTKLEHERVNFGEIWHSDTIYLERPPLGTVLYAVEVPPYGGDTLFANQYLVIMSSTTLQPLCGGPSSVAFHSFPCSAVRYCDKTTELDTT